MWGYGEKSDLKLQLLLDYPLSANCANCFVCHFISGQFLPIIYLRGNWSD